MNDFLLAILISKISKQEYLSLRIYTVVEFVLICLFLRKAIQNSKIKKAIPFSIIGFILFAAVDVIFLGSDSFDSNPTAISCIVILLLCVYYLFEQMKDPDNLFLYAKRYFWIVVGLIIFFAGTFFLFIYSQKGLSDPGFESSFNIINSSFVLLKNLIFSIAFIMKPGQSGENSIRRRNPAFPK
ncbi:hypothetical protein [Pollutibacter soli]|uniref:hypothetical protein n=1 Tax=Pollutibacter soli TaxID=3034157 RepID=UPI0030141332